MNPTTRILKPFSTLVSESYTLVKPHIHALALIAMIPVVFSGAMTAMGPLIKASPTSAVVFGIFSLIILLGSIFFAITQSIVMVKAIHALKHGGTTDASALYMQSAKDFFPYLLVGILAFLIVLGSLAVFIIPAIIASIYFIFTLFTYVFEGKRGFAALTSSASLVRGHFLEVAMNAVGALIVVLVMGFMISFVTGFISFNLHFSIETSNFVSNILVAMFVTPFYSAFFYTMYQDLSSAKSSVSVNVEDDNNFKKTTKILSWIAIVVAIVSAIMVISTLAILIARHSPKAPFNQSYKMILKNI